MSPNVAKHVVDLAVREGHRFFAGVPDSLLSGLSHELTTRDEVRHLIAPNEGSAVALGVGEYLASRVAPIVYMQNSGLGNALNPVVSLAHRDVYGIPMLLVIGMRGELMDADEPQHRVQGSATVRWLEAVGVSARRASSAHEVYDGVADGLSSIHVTGMPAAVLVSRGILDNAHQSAASRDVLPKRLEVLQWAVGSFGNEACFVATTGKTSRELASLDESELAANAFLCIGGMGHALSIALGIAFARPDTKVVCIDGDGSYQMHMGANALVGSVLPGNLVHILVNNGSHESVGGQPVANPDLDYSKLASIFGYRSSSKISSIEAFKDWAVQVRDTLGPHFADIQCASGSVSNLGRPSMTPQDRLANLQNGVLSVGTREAYL